MAALPGKPLILAIAIIICMGVLGAASVDIGAHWDEPRLISSIQTTVEYGWLVPRWYNYPSVCYDVGMLTAAFHGAVSGRHASPVTEEALPAKRELLEFLGSDAFTWELRSVFFLLSCLTGLAVYYLASGLTGRNWVGLLATLTLLGSWEFTYHAKWIAPDCLVALFASCSILGQLGVLKAEKQGQRFLMVTISSIFAGLTVGTKYPGGIVLVPLLLAIGLSAKRHRSRPVLEVGLHALALGLAATVFLVTTPGFFLDPQGFARDVRYELSHYGEGGHAGYSVAPGWGHFSKMSLYLAAVSLSENMVLAVAASVSAAVGIVSLARTQPRITAWFISLPLLYVVYMSSQRVMIVRNCMLLLPFLAVFAALGFGVIASAPRRRSFRVVLFCVFASFVLFNLSMVTRSSLSILYPDTGSGSRAIAEHVTSSSPTLIYLSPGCRKLLAADPAAAHPNVAQSPEAADRFLFLSDEVPGWRLYPANVPGRYRTIWSQMREVNWDYYPSWTGRHRVLEVSASDPELEPLRKRVALATAATDRE
ncbi:MAG TPA: phospholipid carrier-dependent glycosyltransferase [Phycisphaerae bacterium]|nr:phospholipid carrier-dependent glycosyltransferase [Phycisphaerae bacterium]